jgi:Fe-S-cluster containining protein
MAETDSPPSPAAIEPGSAETSSKPELAPRPVTPEDVERGLRFNHAVEHETRKRVAELSASLYAMVETLVARGSLPIDEYDKRRQATLEREQARLRSEPGPTVSNVPDKYALEQLPQIDCEARLPLCQARCCTLVFPLSIQDLDERVVRWDYGKPYQIARRPDGYCVHNRAGTCQCEVYEQRPGICRTYDCRNDKRIWIDFEKRIPAIDPNRS